MHLRKLFPEVCPIEVEKNALVCNASWAVLAFGCWMICTFSKSFTQIAPSTLAPLSGASLTVFAVIASGVGWLLRQPFAQVDSDVLEAAASKDAARTVEDEEKQSRAHLASGILLCGSIAGLNWLGCITLQSQSLLEAFPAWIIILGTEACLLSRPSNLKLLSLLLPLEIQGQAAPTTNDPSVETAHLNSEAMLSTQEHPKFDIEVEDDADDAIWSRTECGTDEEGRIFAAGTITAEISPGESTRDLVIGFTPSFASIPNVEVELDIESMSVRQINVTQAGARLLVRQPGNPSESPVEFCLEWYAVAPAEPLFERPGVSLP